VTTARHLILNADDFGLTRGVNEGIARAHRDGILTSTTLMANGAAFDHAVDLARATPSLGVGCHLVLVGGKSVSPPHTIPSLADSEGFLPASLADLVGRLSAGRLRGADVEREARAQIEKILAAGISPTHFDTHKHTHVLPPVFDVLGRVAQQFGISRVRKPIERLRHSWPSARHRPKQVLGASAVRAIAPRFRALLDKYHFKSPDHFLGLAATGAIGTHALRRLIDALPQGSTEIMLHPGICDADLAQTGSRLQRERELELEALLDSGVRDAVSRHGIRLITYKELS
jgi:hopanoid biosynthesis associated protein HpnK